MKFDRMCVFLIITSGIYELFLFCSLCELKSQKRRCFNTFICSILGIMNVLWAFFFCCCKLKKCISNLVENAKCVSKIFFCMLMRVRVWSVAQLRATWSFLCFPYMLCNRTANVSRIYSSYLIITMRTCSMRWKWLLTRSFHWKFSQFQILKSLSNYKR